MHHGFVKDEANNWVAPLPFCHPRLRLPNNREQALTRLMSLRKTLKRKPEMKEHFVEFMKKTFSKGHAEKAPPLIPTKSVGIPQALAFTTHRSQVKSESSLIQVLSVEMCLLIKCCLKFPDLNNSLVGVLLRFRGEPYAVMTDVEQMFHNFMVSEDHRDYLRFLWF